MGAVVTQAGFEPASMCTAASLLVLVKHTKRATNISGFLRFHFESIEGLVGFGGDGTPGTAEAADTRSIAVELLSQPDSEQIRLLDSSDSLRFFL